MFNTVIDFRTALSILVGIVNEFGAFYSPSSSDGTTGCVYIETQDGQDSQGYATKTIDPLNLKPVCIVGQVFARLGILRAVVLSETTQDTACSLGQTMWDNAANMGVEFTSDAQRFLRLAQAKQDSGIAWGESVRSAVTALQDEKVKEFKDSSGLFDWYATAPLLDMEDNNTF